MIDQYSDFLIVSDIHDGLCAKSRPAFGTWISHLISNDIVGCNLLYMLLAHTSSYHAGTHRL